MTRPFAAMAYADEAALAARWGAGLRSPRRLEDGRALRVVFPGVPGGSSGPDFRGAMLDAGGDLLRGDVELHLRASGWRAHGHATDPAYGAVVLHVVATNDTGALTTLHASGRAIPVLVLPAGRQAAFPPPFTPPCALERARGRDPAPALARLSERRLRMKAARIAPLVNDAGAAQALYFLILEQLGGPANRAAFASLARRLPLASLLEARAEQGALALAAALKHAAAQLALRRAGLRPMAAPAARLDAAALLIHRLWPPSSSAAPAWPSLLVPAAPLRPLRVAGIGRQSAVEIATNAVIPVALVSGACPKANCSPPGTPCPRPVPMASSAASSPGSRPSSAPPPSRARSSCTGTTARRGCAGAARCRALSA